MQSCVESSPVVSARFMTYSAARPLRVLCNSTAGVINTCTRYLGVVLPTVPGTRYLVHDKHIRRRSYGWPVIRHRDNAIPASPICGWITDNGTNPRRPQLCGRKVCHAVNGSPLILSTCWPRTISIYHAGLCWKTSPRRCPSCHLASLPQSVRNLGAYSLSRSVGLRLLLPL